jgi:divinyl chlorophyllide a 8-vinyl-reductase
MTEAAANPRRIALAGASGTIGSAVLRRLQAEGHYVAVLPRGVFIEPDALADGLRDDRIEVMISCIASRSGAPDDALAVDYGANATLLGAAQAAGVAHFILLSAICVQRPRLAFQHAKLTFEAELAASGIGYTIVRPTAFFKSLSGQAARVKAGKPFLIFGDGHLTACKPISDDDLARFIAGCIGNPQALGKVLPIGGPGPALSLRDAGELLFAAAGKAPRFRSVSPGMFTIAAKVLGLGAPLSAWCTEKAEYARIAHYYATESMLVLDPATGEYSADLTPEFGSETLADHYRRLLAEG